MIIQSVKIGVVDVIEIATKIREEISEKYRDISLEFDVPNHRTVTLVALENHIIFAISKGVDKYKGIYVIEQNESTLGFTPNIFKRVDEPVSAPVIRSVLKEDANVVRPLLFWFKQEDISKNKNIEFFDKIISNSVESFVQDVYVAEVLSKRLEQGKIDRYIMV
jgi:hypothetical protein